MAAGCLAIGFAFALDNAAHAQCSTNTNVAPWVETCTYSGQGSAISASTNGAAGSGTNPAYTINLSNTGAVSGGIGVTATGNSPTGNGKNGGSGGAITIQNQGAITATGSSAPDSSNYPAGISAIANGGMGGPNSGLANAGDGGDGGAVSLLDTAPITVSAPNYDGIFALSGGGAGGSGKLGRGGSSSSVSISLGVVNPRWATGWITTAGSGSGAIAASSIGGNADDDAGGNAAGVTIAVGAPGKEQPEWFIQTNGQFADGIYANSAGGFGDQTNPGGTSGNVLVSAMGSNNTPLQITTLGPSSAGIDASSLGGHGGSAHGTDYDNGGNGGASGSVEVNLDVVINTIGANSPGIEATSVGGDGGYASSGENCYRSESCGLAISDGNGGQAGAVTVSLGPGNSPPSSIVTKGDLSPGILAVSEGGNVGTGGNGGTVTVSTGTTTTITTNGEEAVGVFATSLGGGGTTYSSSTQTVDSFPGNSSSVTVENAAAVKSLGAGSAGIVADSITGGGGLVNWAGGGDLRFGDLSGRGAVPQTVTVTNTGAITTGGADAPAIIAQSIGGGGGMLGLDQSSSTASLGGAASSDSNADRPGNSVSVTNSAPLTTAGDGSTGILAQSVGGGGGFAALDSGNASISTIGGGGTSGGAGGTVNVTNSTNIAVSGTDASGIVAQSIGGGGGNGRNANHGIAAVGGIGGAGGNGNNTTVTLSGGTIGVSGDYGYGVEAQSIGGGGGNGGRATSKTFLLPATGIGGAGGSGGTGYDAQVVNLGAIETSGVQGVGLLTQSIGGGGGSGGAASAKTTAFALGIATAVGGSGGNGGDGGWSFAYNGVSAATSNPNGVSPNPSTPQAASTAAITTLGQDAPAILAQTIGGGGGIGGSATAKVLTVGVSLGDVVVPSLSVSTALGASGGNGGDGSNVWVENAGQISTQGNGSDGIMAQSIGGGGGDGADSSALASAAFVAVPGTKDAGTVGFSASTALGGSGGASGAGFPTSVVQDAGGSITTNGDHANGIVAQSIGGGGGSGGLGDASGSDPAAIGIALGVSLGGSGSAGGAGGSVNLSNYGMVHTGGSGARGFVAQSIGGGGGIADSGTAATAAGGTFTANFALGGSGGSGGAGGAVTVNNGAATNSSGAVTVSLTPDDLALITSGGGSGLVATTGNGADGILAQSIGGGGGIAGSADSNASGTTGVTTSPPSSGAGGTSNSAKPPPPPSYALALALGSSGGSGGAGGTVTVYNAGSITTGGSRARGLVAQSVGGGGGTGGVAASAAAAGTVGAAVGLGGSGGSGGVGGQVVVISSGSIATGGVYGAGILAQSVGGGGGIGEDGSASIDTTISTPTSVNALGTTISLGAGKSVSPTLQGQITLNNAGTGGAGGTVQVTSTGAIQTAGADAPAILAQSVGNGGGIADSSAGSGLLNLSFGGNASAAGDGGSVDVNATGVLATTGARGFGLFAQSVGGGGGAVSEPSTTFGTISFGSGGSQQGNGGAIAINLGLNTAATTITTTGAGADGILAQSVGGGGGFAGDSSLASAPGDTIASTLGQGGTGNGGAITINTSPTTQIITSGVNADGIVAQSVGGGGGVIQSNGSLSVGSQGGGGSGGNITITQNGTIAVSGQGASAIVAQSTGGSGSSADNGTITLALNGAVSNGYTAPGPTIGLSGGAAQNSITIGANGTVVSNAAAVPVVSVANTNDAGGYALVNNGTLQGSVNLGPNGNNSFVNNGTYKTDAMVRGTSLTNNGTLITGNAATAAPAVIGATPYAGTTTTFMRGLTLGGRNGTLGRIELGEDFANGTGDQIAVQGPVSGVNDLVIRPVTLLPGVRMPLARTEPGLTLIPVQPLVYTYHLSTNSSAGPDGQPVATTSISASAHFATPTAVSLSTAETGASSLLQNVWNAGTTAGQTQSGTGTSAWNQGFRQSIGSAFANLAVAATSNYAATLDSIAPQLQGAGAADALSQAEAIAAATQSCPAFEGEDAILSEGSCVWERTIGRWMNRSTDSALGYSGHGVTVLLGGQKKLPFGWFIGGVIAYDQNWFSRTDGHESSNGESGLGAVTVKHQIGRWLFSAALGGGGGSTSLQRTVEFPGLAPALATGNQSLGFGIGQLRASYQFVYHAWYARPELALDAMYLQTGGYTESGAGLLNVQVGARGRPIYAATPQIQIGRRIVMRDGLSMRPYGSIGLSALSAGSWATPIRLASAPGVGYSDIETPLPSLVGRFAIGLDIHRPDGLEAKLSYSSSVGGSGYISQTAMLRLGYRF
jgi:hypothetical protein